MPCETAFMREASIFAEGVCNESSTHGLKYVASRELAKVERLTWLTAILACFGFSVYLIFHLYEAYVGTPVIVSFQSGETTVQQIPFPAITLCNVNIFKRSVLLDTKNEATSLLVISNLTNGSLDGLIYEYAAALDNLSQFCLSTASQSFRRLSNYTMCDSEGVPDFIQEVHDVLLRLKDSDYKKFQSLLLKAQNRTAETYRKAATDCQDLVLKCRWNGEEFACAENFLPLDMENGRCCTFNMMPRFLLQKMSRGDRRAVFEEENLPPDAIPEWAKFSLDTSLVRAKGNVSDGVYPRYQPAGGMQYGLSILVNPNLAEYSTCTTNDGYGFTMDAHSTLSMPNILEYGTAIPVHSEVFVSIEPIGTDADFTTMRGLDINARECCIPSDKEADLEHFNFYTADNCWLSCLSSYVFQNCSCIPHYLPRLEQQDACRATQMKCAVNTIEKLMVGTQIGQCSKCRPACTNVRYKMSVNHFGLRDDAPFYYTDASGLNKTAHNYSIIHVYFGTDSFHIYERREFKTLANILGAAGSLLGFTLGISIVSFVEFVYYLTLRIYFHWKLKRCQQSVFDKSSNRKGEPVTIYPFLR